ncbi:hypothetical protein Gohar_014760, partial [Gossypium harknessii]|nr:hypothetical protein [Gossypium harknessii]
VAVQVEGGADRGGRPRGSKVVEEYYKNEKKLLEFQIGNARMETWRRLLTALHLQHINAARLLQKPTAFNIGKDEWKINSKYMLDIVDEPDRLDRELAGKLVQNKAKSWLTHDRYNTN